MVPRAKSLPESDPLPPDDLVTDRHQADDLDRLYRERAPGLVQHFSSRTNDLEAATDVVHEAFARFAGLSHPRRQSIVRPDSFLFRICLNLFRDRCRAEASRRAGEAAIIDTAEPDNPVVHLESRDTLRRLERAMLGLKPKTRAIFLARRLDGLSYAEIAERTGLTIWGVEKQMAKAIATIDRLMERD